MTDIKQSIDKILERYRWKVLLPFYTKKEWTYEKMLTEAEAKQQLLTLINKEVVAELEDIQKTRIKLAQDWGIVGLPNENKTDKIISDRITQLKKEIT